MTYRFRWWRGVWQTRALRWRRFAWHIQTGASYKSVGIMSAIGEMIDNEMETTK